MNKQSVPGKYIFHVAVAWHKQLKYLYLCLIQGHYWAHMSQLNLLLLSMFLCVCSPAVSSVRLTAVLYCGSSGWRLSLRCLSASGLSLPLADGFDELPLGGVFLLPSFKRQRAASGGDGLRGNQWHVNFQEFLLPSLLNWRFFAAAFPY